MTPEFTEIENQRLEQVKKQIPDFDKFNLVLFEEEANCSLKFYAQVLLNYELKWPHLENLSLQEWIEKHALTNIDLSFSVPKLQFPDYFSKTETACTDPAVFKDWPL